MTDPLTSTVSDRICKHMNDDHSDAIVLFAKAYGNLADAQSAKMIAIDPHGMNLKVQTQGAELPVRIEFDHVLKDSEDAHHTLIEMAKQARKS